MSPNRPSEPTRAEKMAIARSIQDIKSGRIFSEEESLRLIHADNRNGPPMKRPRLERFAGTTAAIVILFTWIVAALFSIAIAAATLIALILGIIWLWNQVV